MTWANQDLVVEQNSQLVSTYLFFDQPADPTIAQFGNPSDLVPHDFTGASLKMQVRQNEQWTSTLIDTYSTATGEMAFVAGTISPGPAVPGYNNGFMLTVTGPRSAALASGVYFYDIFATVAGVSTRIMAGTFEVVPTQTR